MTLKVTDNKDN